MESTYNDIISKKVNNIGSLCFFLSRNKDVLDFIDSKIPIGLKNSIISEKVYYYLNNIKQVRLCGCGKPLKFIGFKQGHHKTCGDTKCIVDLRKKTNTEKYGVDNPLKSSEIINKRLETINEKWKGHYMNDLTIKNKFKETMNSRYGVDYSMQSEQIKEKSKISWENNPDKQTIIDKRSQSNKNKSVEEKRDIQKKKEDTLSEKFGSYDNFIEHLNISLKEKSIEKWGVSHHFLSKEVISKRVDSYENNKINSLKEKLPSGIDFVGKFKNKNLTDDYIKLKCNSCLSEFEITRQYLDYRIRNNEELCLILEAGYWGIVSSTSFSLTYDVVKDLNQGEWNLSHYVGIKPYFTIHDDDEFSHMVYVMLKINVVDLDDVLLEFGYNPNYKIGKDNLISVTLGNQVTSTTQWSLFTSVGYIRLF